VGYSLLNYLSLITIGISGLSILAGLFFIKKGKREIHRFFMINASIFALVFVLLYVLKSILYPPQSYTGPYRGLFLFILWTHTLLAIVNFPLAVITLRYAFKNMFEKHRKIAPITAFVWLYVAITGWLIYFFMQWLNKNA
jgi:putative membrane protein